MESNGLANVFNLSLGKEATVSIIGVGSGVGRIVDRIQACGLPNTELCAVGMNGEELKEIVFLHKYLSNKLLSCLIVCLGGDAEENCIKAFLQKADDMKIPAKLLVVKLPHSSEGVEKRRNALQFLSEIEESVSGIFVVDCDAFHCSSIPESFEKADEKVVDIVNAFVCLIVKRSMIGFDFNDVKNFLEYRSCKKIIDYFTLSGNIDCLKNELKDVWSSFSLKYPSWGDISGFLFVLYYNRQNPQVQDDTVLGFLKMIYETIMKRLNDHTDVKWTIIDTPDLPEEIFRVDIFTKF